MLESTLTLLCTGLAIGLVSPILGIGGGVIIVPTLILLYPKLPTQVAMGTSLMIIFLSSLIHLNSFRKAGKYPYKDALLPLLVSAVAGVLVSSPVALHLSPLFVRRLFALVLVGVVMRNLVQGVATKAAFPENRHFGGSRFMLALVGFLGGVVSGLTGLGGGAVIVPLLLTLGKFNPKWVSLYSQGAMAMISFVGVLSYKFFPSPYSTQIVLNPFLSTFQVGMVNLYMVACIVAGAYTSSKIGVKWEKELTAKTKNKLFVILFSLIAVRILVV